MARPGYLSKYDSAQSIGHRYVCVGELELAVVPLALFQRYLGGSLQVNCHLRASSLAHVVLGGLRRVAVPSKGLQLKQLFRTGVGSYKVNLPRRDSLSSLILRPGAHTRVRNLY